MIHRTMPARGAPLFPVAAKQGQTPDAGFTADFQDQLDRGMKQIVCLNSCMLEIYGNAFLFALVPGNLFDTAAKAVASFMELQRNRVALLAPFVSSHVSTAASNSGSQAQPTADELAHYMDIAIGERFTAPGMSFTTSSGRLAKQTAKGEHTANPPQSTMPQFA